MRNAALEETQAGIKVAGRNLNNLRYADDTALMEESEEELHPPEARDGGQEEQPHAQGAVAAWTPEGLEELFHLQVQEGRQ